jgi:hypothetical protein
MEHRKVKKKRKMSSDDVFRWCPLVNAEGLVMQSLGSFWKMDGGGYIFLFGCVPSFLRVFSRFFYFVCSKFLYVYSHGFFISLTRSFLRVFSRFFLFR